MKGVSEQECKFSGKFVAKEDPHHCLGEHQGLENQTLTDIPEPPTIQKSTKVAMDIAKLTLNPETGNSNIHCYLPQPGDEIRSVATNAEPMGPVGPWATGKVDWSPLAGLTGTRPIVDKYSITRFSPGEWRERNRMVLQKTNKSLEDARKNSNNCKNISERTYDMVNRNQAENTQFLKDRAQLVNKWKSTLERAIQAMIDEITTLEEERLRVKKSLVILGVPESIVKECIDRRCSRPETELIRDRPEEELVKELGLIAEIRRLLKKTLADIEAQQIENRTARQRLEYDWSDKKESYEIESINVGLRNQTKTIMFRPGAMRLPAEQASGEYWEHFTSETLEECEKCRQKSVELRGTLDAILLNAARDLRTQADMVESAFVVRVNCMQENLNRLENELKDCLQNLADTENRIESMTRGIRSLDNAMKVAQTRLDNRGYRPHVENCRDSVQFSLLDEVNSIQNGVSGMLAALNEAESVKVGVMQTRGNLEREIMLKRRTLMLDRERCLLLRTHFPSANSLSGFAAI